MHGSQVRKLILGAAACAYASTSLAAEDGKDIAIGELLKAGWQIAGYTSTVDNRSTFILLRHADEQYLVQCRAGYDVTREPRVHTNCYELR